MLKGIGCLCILLGGCWARALQVTALRRELRVLADLLETLDRMDTEIRVNRTPLPRLLARLAPGRTRPLELFLCRVSEAARRGEYLPGVWTREANGLPLGEEDRRTLRALGERLPGDEETACKGIELARSFLSGSLEEKRAGRADRERRTTALCLSGAALLAILLL